MGNADVSVDALRQIIREEVAALRADFAYEVAEAVCAAIMVRNERQKADWAKDFAEAKKRCRGEPADEKAIEVSR